MGIPMMPLLSITLHSFQSNMRIIQDTFMLDHSYLRYTAAEAVNTRTDLAAMVWVAVATGMPAGCTSPE